MFVFRKENQQSILLIPLKIQFRETRLQSVLKTIQFKHLLASNIPSEKSVFPPQKKQQHTNPKTPPSR